jgi:hypothetical protein
VVTLREVTGDPGELAALQRVMDKPVPPSG